MSVNNIIVCKKMFECNYPEIKIKKLYNQT